MDLLCRVCHLNVQPKFEVFYIRFDLLYGLGGNIRSDGDHQYFFLKEGFTFDDGMKGQNGSFVKRFD